MLKRISISVLSLLNLKFRFWKWHAADGSIQTLGIFITGFQYRWWKILGTTWQISFWIKRFVEISPLHVRFLFVFFNSFNSILAKVVKLFVRYVFYEFLLITDIDDLWPLFFDISCFNSFYDFTFHFLFHLLILLLTRGNFGLTKNDIRWKVCLRANKCRFVRSGGFWLHIKMLPLIHELHLLRLLGSFTRFLELIPFFEQALVAYKSPLDEFSFFTIWLLFVRRMDPALRIREPLLEIILSVRVE